MRNISRSAAIAAGILMAAALLGACGSSGSSGTKPAVAASSGGCAPIADKNLVVLTDDKNLQSTDNIIPAINDKANSPALLAAVNAVSAALTTPKLVELNKSVDVDRQTPEVAAKAFAQSANLTNGLTKGPGGKIIVGAANFSENQEIAELYKIALTAAGYQVTVQTIGNRELYEPQLEKGTIQVVPEYAATLTEFLNTKQNGASAPAAASSNLTTTVSALTALGAKAHIVFGTPSAATDENAFAVTKALATKYNLKTLSDFAAKCSGGATKLAGPPECASRSFCQPGLEKTYGMKFGAVLQTDSGGPITKTALTTGQATIGLVLSSDSAFASS
jgi:osmoprotectant transport system substrate-binding protein